MQNAWTNPFAEKRREINWQSCVGGVSDDDDSCPDQVVYHEDHLENLFGLYNRVEEVKYGHPSHQELLKTGVECYNDHILLAVPSRRETAVWDALEASESTFQEAFQAPENDREKLWSYNTLKANEGGQVFGGCLDDGPTDDLEDEEIAVASCEPAEAGYVEAFDGVNIDKVNSKDGWDHVAQQANTDMDDIQDHVAGLSSSRPKSYCLVKQPKGMYKKKLNFNFRSMHNVPSLHRCAEVRDNCQKLSLAQKLQSLAETNCPSASKMNMQNIANYSAPCTKVPICEKLLELVQNDSSHISEKKARKAFNTKVKSNSFKQNVKMDKIAAGGVTSSHALEREDYGAELSLSNIGVQSESINDQFRRALLAAPPASTEDLNRQGKSQGLVFGFAARLQKVVEREKNDRTHFLKMLQTREDCQERLNCMDVKILSKNLEARLSTCLCNILKFPEAHGEQATSNVKVMVIFNMETNAQLELEAGRIVRLYPPWQEVLREDEVAKIILCTYYCEVLTNHDVE